MSKKYSIRPARQGVTNVERAHVKITLPGDVRISIIKKDNDILGVGEVSVCGILLRSPRPLIRPSISTPNGICYRRFLFDGVKQQGDCVILRTRAVGEMDCFQEREDQYDYPMVTTEILDEPVEDILEWVFAPASRRIEGQDFVGYSYTYRFLSSSRRIHQLLDRTTWEIGGRASGNTIISQGAANPPEFHANRQAAFDTRCKNFINGKAQSVSIEMTSRMGTMQCFDYQFCSKGSLLIYYDSMWHCKGLVEKRSGSELIQHYDSVAFPLTNDVTLPKKLVLFNFSNEKRTITEGRNIWADCRDYVFTHYRKEFGVRKENIHPSAYLAIAPKGSDLEKKRMHYLADEAVPKLARAGFRFLRLHPMWRSDYTKGVSLSGHPGTAGGQCCVWDWNIHKLYGGEKALRHLCMKGREYGITVVPWIGLQLSKLSPLLKKHPDWAIIHLNDHHYSGSYIDLVSAGLHSGHGNYLLKKLRSLKERTSFGGVFHDSYGNMSAMPIDMNDPEMKPQARDLARFVADVQGMGLVSMVEAVGPFGIPITTVTFSAKEKYQKLWQWLKSAEHAVYGTCLQIDAESVRRGAINNNCWFRLLAYGGSPGICFRNTTEIDSLNERFRKLLRIHGQACPYMDRRMILENGNGVEWFDSKRENRILFAFKDFNYDIGDSRHVQELLDGKEVIRKNKLHVNAYRAYLVSRSNEN